MAKRNRKTQRLEPGYDGKIEIRADEVDNPLDGGKTKNVVFRNMLSSPGDYMRARGQIDETQKVAYDYFAAAYEQSKLSGAGAIDASKDIVDSSSESVSEVILGAIEALNHLRPHLGKVDYRIVELIAGEGLSMNEVASMLYDRDGAETARKYVGKRFREALDTIAEVIGKKGKGASGRRKMVGGPIR